MAKLNQFYKCDICGNIVELVHVGGGQLVCCGEPMRLLNENTVDASLEKHVPIIEHKDGKTIVKVGSIEHPMTEEHYIEWIEIHTKDGKVTRKFLKPGEKPEAEFFISMENVLFAREYCNLHGLWKS